MHFHYFTLPKEKNLLRAINVIKFQNEFNKLSVSSNERKIVRISALSVAQYNFSFIFWEKGWLDKFILKFTDLYLTLILYARKELAVERFKIIKAILKQNSAFPVYWLLLPLHITLSICFLFQYQCPIYYWSCKTDKRFSDIFIIVIHTWIKGIDKANALLNTVCKFSWLYHIC